MNIGFNKSDKRNEKKIIQGCYSKDPIAQELLYRRYYGYTLGICLRFSANEDDARELVNDSWLKIFRNINKYNTKKDFKPWIRSIIVNTAIDKYRRRMYIHFENLPEDDCVVFQEDILDYLSTQDLLQTINALPEKLRLVFNLYVIEGFSHKEIAKILNVKEASSRSYLTRAKEQLKNEILKMIAYEETLPR